MAPADSLSHHDFINTSSDNVNTSIVSEAVVINALDLALTHHMKSSSSSDPLILHVLENLADGSPLFARSTLFAWTYDKLQILRDNKLYLKHAKCEFKQSKTEYLRLIVGHQMIKMDPTRVTGITGWPVPITRKQLCKSIISKYSIVQEKTNPVDPLP